MPKRGGFQAPRVFKKIIAKGMQPDPSQRWSSLRELLNALRKAQAGRTLWRRSLLGTISLFVFTVIFSGVQYFTLPGGWHQDEMLEAYVELSRRSKNYLRVAGAIAKLYENSIFQAIESESTNEDFILVSNKYNDAFNSLFEKQREYIGDVSQYLRSPEDVAKVTAIVDACTSEIHEGLIGNIDGPRQRLNFLSQQREAGVPWSKLLPEGHSLETETEEQAKQFVRQDLESQIREALQSTDARLHRVHEQIDVLHQQLSKRNWPWSSR